MNPARFALRLRKPKVCATTCFPSRRKKQWDKPLKAYHLPMSIRAAIFLIAPRVIELILALVALRYRPRAVKRWIVVAGIFLAAGGIISTLLISRPNHAQLGIQGNTPELVSRLMATD